MNPGNERLREPGKGRLSKQKQGRHAPACLLLLSILCVFFFSPVQADSDQPETSDETIREYSLNDFYFDTFVSLRFEAGSDGDELLDGCSRICDEIQRTFSRTDENSELYAVNHRKTDRVEVSAPLAEVVQAGLDYYEISDGRFDITIAPLSDLWDFKREEASVPSEAEIQSALRKIDASSVHVESEEDESGQTGWYLVFDRPDTMIDLGALVKGYAADRIAAFLREEGITSGLINLGGNVYALGGKPDGSAWKIGIQKPFDTGIVDTVEVKDQSVVSSGVYERCFELDGILYHHILDPATGYPVQNSLWGVSIISDSSLEGDALSTVSMLLGQDEAMDLIGRTDGVRAIFIDNALHVKRSE